MVWPQKIVFFGVPCVFFVFLVSTPKFGDFLKPKKHKVFLVFAFQNQKSKKKQQQQGKQKKTSFEAKPKRFFQSFFFCFLGFEVLGLLSLSTYCKLSEKLRFLIENSFQERDHSKQYVCK